MSKFNLEAAKRGEAVQYKSKDGKWKDTVLLAADLVMVKKGAGAWKDTPANFVDDLRGNSEAKE